MRDTLTNLLVRRYCLAPVVAVTTVTTKRGVASRRGVIRERGAAIVEFSIVSLLLMTLAIGTYEMGMAWNDAQLVTQAARSGARVGGQLGSDPQTDQRVVEAIEAALGDLDNGLVKIVIFNSTAPDGTMPGACDTATHPGVAGLCSVYDISHFTTFTQGAWDPATRDDDLQTAEYLGVWIEVDRPLMTGFFGTSPLKITDSAVLRIEPRF